VSVSLLSPPLSARGLAGSLRPNDLKPAAEPKPIRELTREEIAKLPAAQRLNFANEKALQEAAKKTAPKHPQHRVEADE
jgi:hypothetical protein